MSKHIYNFNKIFIIKIYTQSKYTINNNIQHKYTDTKKK